MSGTTAPTTPRLVGQQTLALALGCTVQAVHRQARQQGWPCREITGTRGVRVRLFPIATLPDEVRRRLGHPDAEGA